MANLDIGTMKNWLSTNGNTKMTIIGSFGFAVWLALVTGLMVWTAMTVSAYLSPRGQPLKILSLEFTGPVVPDERTWVKVVVDKSRYCQPIVQIAFFDGRGQELRSVLVDWPVKELGESVAWPSFLAPKFPPGNYQAIIRGIWDCQDDDYFVASPLAESVFIKGPSKRSLLKIPDMLQLTPDSAASAT